jgi:hypothetical protein
MIASKVRRLTVGAVCIPCECIEYITITTTAVPTTTTTTTAGDPAQTTTTTTTSAVPIITTTTTTNPATTTTTTTQSIVQCLDGLIIEAIYLQLVGDMDLLPDEYVHPCPTSIGIHSCNRAFFEVYGNGVYMADSLLNNAHGVDGAVTYSGKEVCTDYFNTPADLTGGVWTGSPISRYSKTILTQQQAIDIANAGGGGNTIDLSLISAMTTYSSACDGTSDPHTDVTWLRISTSEGTVIWNSCVEGSQIYTIDVCTPQ